MQTVVYDGSFDGFLCAVFDIYEYRFKDVMIVPEDKHQPSMFASHHVVVNDAKHCYRVWNGLKNKLSKEAQESVYRSFLSEITDIENILFRYIQYVFSLEETVEKDYSHPAVLLVHQTAKKVWREKHRMEAFVRFQKTADDLYYSVIEPDFNVLPLIAKHFASRYADQRWMIYDAKRKYGLFYNLSEVSVIQVQFSEQVLNGKSISNVYDEEEEIYQKLWMQYFKSVNIPSRKNTKLHVQHMPTKYWKYLVEKKPFNAH